jgi:hypothetical protein
MKIRFVILLATFFSGCNSSSPKKDSNQAIDETPGLKNQSANTATNVGIKPVKIIADQIPASIEFKGKLHEAWQWTDNLGENILITSFVEPYDDKGKNEYGEEGQTAELHASHYVKKDGGYALLWNIDDGEKSCPFDITCKFIKDAITVTDLDKDGLAETTIQFRLACRSDVSPSEMVLIMHEGTFKYYLLGYSWIKSSEEDKFTVTEQDANLETLPGYKKTEAEYMKTFGRYESEKGFADAPHEFLLFARQQWMKFVKESFE